MARDIAAWRKTVADKEKKETDKTQNRDIAAWRKGVLEKNAAQSQPAKEPVKTVEPAKLVKTEPVKVVPETDGAVLQKPSIENSAKQPESLKFRQEARAKMMGGAQETKTSTAKTDETLKDVQQFLYNQGLKKLDEKYKGLNPLARANSPEYKSDLINLAKTTGYYDADAKEPAKMYNTEATKKVIPYLGEKAKMGLMDFGAGLTKLNEIGKSGDGETLTPAQRMQVQQDINKAEFQKAEQENVSPALQKVGGAVQATSAMIPNIMLSAVNPTMGLAQLGLSAAGSSAHQAMTENATKGQAMAYGALSGGIEVGAEKLFGGLPFMKGVGDKVAGKLINPIKNKVIKAGVKWVMNMGEEALEEGIAGVLDPFAKRLTYDKDVPMATFAEIGEQMLMGAAVAGILGIPGTVINTKGKQTPTIQ
jgi:hypothetical protein